MNILIIDDEEGIREVLSDILTDDNHTVFTAENGDTGIKILDREKVDICFLDVWMPKTGGIDVLATIKETYPHVEVVMISGHAKIDQAVRVTKMGAFDFLEKPLSIERIMSVIKNIEMSKTVTPLIYSTPLSTIDTMIGESLKIKEIKKLIETSAKTDTRVLILGENGTGKELVAREIHSNSLRKNKPFISVNCAAIPENLIESELFGHVKGSFTSAVNDRPGKLELANKGTFFLDEVADMPLSLQAKLLRVLQEMKITRIGGSEEISLDVRIISATNKDIKEEINKGNFREDLYYRLNVIPIVVPSLKERKEDIPLLINYFNTKLAESNSIKPKLFTKEAIHYLCDYNWPGNIRQLRNIIERLLVMVSEDTVGIEQVNTYIDKDFTSNDPVYDIISRFRDFGLNDAREQFEREFIISKLSENNYNLTQTARVLGVFPSNLSAKITKLGIITEGKK
ncbi:MAG: Fis family transcriptional regulator [Spirochaetes bacterium GWF1_31_7]|nr:MAG: Fis family transcriptional regulator [Spirochaetes bacterium GWE1_32_154]OHD49122.1 MAG: Fis family transcriptional regulator [Spirochaetes bacterium GWF1_31_7]OHD50292.1 MAG: Fis family transcriptional regulator [Spirochaetes bacterium GWE2_31_10]OHD82871.1 MAG: Fis family transcriptional regulator [Spirochaetes bacterium RIFOXYB1_FULL_32_8]HBD93922.1 Fis family transcriptional regulator [Spirochaetia bacterium]